MLELLPTETRNDIRTLRNLLEGKGGNYVSSQQRDEIMNRLQNSISDIVLSLLISEDRNHQQYFLTHR